jgi:hypothetical protein
MITRSPVVAYRKGLLRRLPKFLILILARRPALVKLLLEWTERLISRPANSADQSDAVLDERFEILTHEPMLQLYIGARVHKPEEFLRRLQIGVDYALDQTGHAPLQRICWAHYFYLWEPTVVRQTIETAWTSVSSGRTFVEVLVPLG